MEGRLVGKGGRGLEAWVAQQQPLREGKCFLVQEMVARSSELRARIGIKEVTTGLFTCCGSSWNVGWLRDMWHLCGNGVSVEVSGVSWPTRQGRTEELMRNVEDGVNASGREASSKRPSVVAKTSSGRGRKSRLGLSAGLEIQLDAA